MSDLGWRADGIDRARAAGGVELEVYQRPGFVRGKAVRRAAEGASANGVPIDPEWPGADDPEPFASRACPRARVRARA